LWSFMGISSSSMYICVTTS